VLFRNLGMRIVIYFQIVLKLLSQNFLILTSLKAFRLCKYFFCYKKKFTTRLVVWAYFSRVFPFVSFYLLELNFFLKFLVLLNLLLEFLLRHFVKFD